MTTKAAEKALPIEYPLIIESRFGDLVINEENLINMPQGIYGFDQLHLYGLVRLPGPNENNFMVLQSLEEIGIAFLLTPLTINDVSFIPVEDVDEAAKALKLDTKDCDYFLITTARQENDKLQLSLNLKAPVIVDRKQGQAWQYILENKDYPIQYNLDI